MQITRELAKRVSVTKVADIPRESVDYAKTLMLSAFGAVVQGSGCPGGDIVTRYVQRCGGAAEATLFGSYDKLPVELTALANASFAHATEYEDDSFPEAVSSYTIFPAVLALGEHLKSSGSDAIAAFVAGYETQARIGLVCLAARRMGYMVLSLAGSIGCAASAARLLHLGPEATTHALSIAASQAGGLGYQTGTMAHIMEMGFSARNGITAAFLAKDGYTGQLDILEAPRGLFNVITAGKAEHPEQVITDWGRPYRIHEVGIKEFPCCYHLQRMIEATTDVRRSGISADDVECVEVEVNAFFPTVVQHGDPANELQAQFSLPHAVAAAFFETRIGQSSFSRERITDPRFQEFRQRVSVIVRDDWGWSPTGWTPRMSFRLKNGQTLVREPEHSRGQPPNLFSFDEAIPKYIGCVESTLSDKAVRQSIQLMRRLELVPSMTHLIEAIHV